MRGFGRARRGGNARGFAPARRGPFVAGHLPVFPLTLPSPSRGEGYKARARPSGCLCPSPRLLGLRNSLRSDSPRPHIGFGTGGAATPAGAMRWRHTLALSFSPRPLGEGRVRAILTASPGGMRCRPYNYGEAAAKATVVIPSAARNLPFPSVIPDLIEDPGSLPFLSLSPRHPFGTAHRPSPTGRDLPDCVFFSLSLYLCSRAISWRCFLLAASPSRMRCGGYLSALLSEKFFHLFDKFFGFGQRPARRLFIEVRQRFIVSGFAIRPSGLRGTSPIFSRTCRF